MIEQTLPAEFLEMADLQQKKEKELLSKQNVVGVALGNKIKDEEDTGEKALQVLVRHKMPEEMLGEEDLVPQEVDGVQTDVVEVGEIVAGPLAPDIISEPQVGLDFPFDEDSDWEMAEEFEDGIPQLREGPLLERQRRRMQAPTEVAPQQLRQRIRPAMGGFSVGHYRITAGTIGTCCYDLSDFPGIPDQFYILSNNHVLANSNNASIGDPILQPGPYDGGQYPQDMIGRLSRFVPIRFRTSTSAPSNYVDAAIAEVPFHQANREVYWIGYVKDLYTAPTVGDILQKTGRTTNFSTGRVQSINATVNVNYGNGRVARFVRQILTSAMSAGGDSGSLVTNLDEEGVGLLFAGSPYVTVLNNILYVQALLRVRIHEK